MNIHDEFGAFAEGLPEYTAAERALIEERDDAVACYRANANVDMLLTKKIHELVELRNSVRAVMSESASTVDMLNALLGAPVLKRGETGRFPAV